MLKMFLSLTDWPQIQRLIRYLTFNSQYSTLKYYFSLVYLMFFFRGIDLQVHNKDLICKLHFFRLKN